MTNHNINEQQLPASSNDKRQILKFDANGMPYYKTLEHVPGINTIKNAMKDRVATGDTEPIIVVGDLSGMADLNNYYGREIADGAIEKALTIFVDNFSGAVGIAASPSGDEMWGVPHRGAVTGELIKHLTKILIQFNEVDYPAGKDNLGLNAKFYIGRKKFSEAEKYLKINHTTGEKIPPGRIIIEGRLLNRTEDVILEPKGVSNEKIIVRRTDEISTGRDGQAETRDGTGGLQGRSETEDSEKRAGSPDRITPQYRPPEYIKARINLAHPFILGDTLRAKQGDPIAIVRVLSKACPAKYQEEIKSLLGETDDIVYIPISPQAGGKNILPLAYAHFLAENIGGKVAPNLVLEGSIGIRRKQQIWERFVTPRLFSVQDPEKLKSNRVVLIDDHYTTGGTIRDAFVALEKAEIKVAHIITLGTSREKRFFALPEQVQEYNLRFTVEEKNEIKRFMVYEPDRMTKVQLDVILKIRRNEHVLQKTREAVQKTRYQSVRVSSQKAPGGIERLSDNNQTVIPHPPAIPERTLTAVPSHRLQAASDKQRTEPTKDKPEAYKRESLRNTTQYPIHNHNALEKILPFDWRRKKIEQAMYNTSIRLDERFDITNKQKQNISAVLNGRQSDYIWTKLSLSPDGRIASARILSGEVDKVQILEGLPSEEKLVIEDVIRNKAKSRMKGYDR